MLSLLSGTYKKFFICTNASDNILITMTIHDQIKHPCLTHHQLLDSICTPVKELGVTFFGYTALSQDGEAYCLGSKYDYAAAYLQSNHVTSDVHYRPAFKTKRFHYHFWDFVKLDTRAESLYRMAAEFNQGHTLTVMRFDEEITHCFHFSGNLNDTLLNQRFLEKMDSLHAFMDYFDDCLQNVPEIAAIYDYPTHLQPTNQDKPFTIIENDPRVISLPTTAKQELRFKHGSRYYLTLNERKCISWLRQGKSAEMIADIFGVSRKTVERHIAAIKRKYDSYTLYQLGEKICAAGLAGLL